MSMNGVEHVVYKHLNQIFLLSFDIFVFFYHCVGHLIFTSCLSFAIFLELVKFHPETMSASSKFFKDDETEAFMNDQFLKIFPESSPEEIFEWLGSSPASTVLRICKEKITREAFVEKLSSIIEEIRPNEGYKILSHDAVTDVVVVVVDSTLQRNVEPVDQVAVVGSMCGAAVLRGADVYAPGLIFRLP